MKRTLILLALILLAEPAWAAQEQPSKGMTVWTATAADLNPPVDTKPATRRDIIAGQIYAAFISRYSPDAFKGGSYVVSKNLLDGNDDGSLLMKSCIIAADRLIKELDAKK